MCVTKELKHMVCLHTDKYTKECLNKRGSLLGCFVKCSPRVQSSNQYDLCHECRRYWAEHNISELEATRSYVNYREAHDNTCPLSPTFILSVNDIVQQETISATGEFDQANQTYAGPSGINIGGLQNITPLLYGRANPERRSSDASVRTQWPNPSELGDGSAQDARPQKGKRKEVIRDPIDAGPVSPKGVVLLSEDEESPPKWV